MRKYLMVSLALIFALGSAFAFRQTQYYFRFDGDTTAWEDRVDEDMYTKIDIVCDVTEVVLCEILAPDADNDQKPDIGTSGSLYNALYNSGNDSPNFAPSAVVGKQ